MKKLLVHIFPVIILAGAFVSCRNEEVGEGEGYVRLSLSIDDNVKVHTRAADGLEESCTINIYNSSDKLVRRFNGAGELPEKLWLLSGEYRAEGIAGTKSPASFTDRYFTGSQPFTIYTGLNTGVTLTCGIKNVVVSISEESDDISGLLSDWRLTVGHSGASLEFTSENISSKGYYMMPEGENDLIWTFTATQPGGENLEKTGKVENVQAAHEYALKIRYIEDGADPIGGAVFEIVVDDSTVDMEENVTIFAPPVITVEEKVSENTIKIHQGEAHPITFYVTSPLELGSINLSSEAFTQMGLSSNTIDCLELDRSEKDAMAEKGLVLSYLHHTDDTSIAKMVFSGEMFGRLGGGEYTLTISATDIRNGEQGITRTEEYNLNVGEIAIEVAEISPSDIKYHSATLRADIFKDGLTGVKFIYRKVGENEWKEADATVEGNKAVATVSGLADETAYEFLPVCNEAFAFETGLFTTLRAVQLENSGFEEWNTAVGVLYPGGGIWDSFNSVSKKNNTAYSPLMRHSGNYSIRMVSTFNMGNNFIAGTVFTGEFLEYNESGIIIKKGITFGLGIPFNSRPKALRGYAFYQSELVSLVGENCPEAVQIGYNDNGIIYIALLTDRTQTYKEKSFPQIVKNNYGSDSQYFDKDGDNVIAYGELIWKATTEGENMREFTVNLDYKLDAVPAYIIVYASSSRFGEYSTGGYNSTLYLDDLELVYE